MRKFGLCTAAVLLVGLSVAIADEFNASITKVGDGEITILKKKKGDKKGEESTLKLAKEVKVLKGKFNADTKKLDATDEKIENGLKNEMFGKAVQARITTDGDNKVTQIVVGTKKKKGT